MKQRFYDTTEVTHSFRDHFRGDCPTPDDLMLRLVEQQMRGIAMSLRYGVPIAERGVETIAGWEFRGLDLDRPGERLTARIDMTLGAVGGYYGEGYAVESIVSTDLEGRRR